MKIIISEEQLKSLEDEMVENERMEMTKLFVENYKWRFPEWVKKIEVTREEHLTGNPVITVFVEHPDSLGRKKWDSLIDTIWTKIYDTIGIPTAISLQKF